MVVAIPARFGSTRLPGKVLEPLAGRPLIEHVYARAAAAPGLARVVVLTDDRRIADTVRGFGGEVEMTPTDCATGTDRIAWAARSWPHAPVINVQGDKPLIDPGLIAELARHLVEQPADPMVTAAAPATAEDLSNPNVVKVVTDLRGYALYFSRAPIPWSREVGRAPLRHHIGIYGYQSEALFRLAGMAQTPLERVESLEQLRALENGMAIRVLEAVDTSPGVDTIEDLRRVEALIVGERG